MTNAVELQPVELFLERLPQRVQMDPNGGCWLWENSHGGKGYARISLGRHGDARAHRLSYEAFVGPVPDGMLVCHKCDVRCCVNPDHLFLGTALENSWDMCRKGRSAHAKLSPDDVTAIRASGEPYRALSRKYGVTISAIHYARSRTTWAHLSDEQVKHDH